MHRAHEMDDDEDPVIGTTVVVQEFDSQKTSTGSAGMNHLRVHIVPRRESDERSNEEITRDLDKFAHTFTQQLKDQDEDDEKLQKEAQKYVKALRKVK